MARRKKIKKEGKVAIPTSSMSDIAFLLLIFFMVSTTFRKEVGLKVLLPEARATEKLTRTRDISHIYIGKDGKISVDDKIVSPDLLKLAYIRKVEEKPEIIVSMKADKNAKYDYVDKVIESLRDAKALRVVFATNFKR